MRCHGVDLDKFQGNEKCAKAAVHFTDHFKSVFKAEAVEKKGRVVTLKNQRASELLVARHNLFTASDKRWN
jgi:hypothetical protein